MVTIDLRNVKTPEEAKRLMGEGLHAVPKFCPKCLHPQNGDPTTTYHWTDCPELNS